MDRSLWLLLRLRGLAWARRWVHNLRSLKGLLLAVVGSLVFVPMIVTAVVGHFAQVGISAQTSAIHRYGPLGLCFYCFLQVLLSAGDRAVYFTPAEVNFLFCGPFRPRQLLLFKVCAGIGAGLLMTPFLGLALAPHAESIGSGMVGVFLAIEFLYLFSLALGLLISTIGAYAFDRARKLLLVAVGILAVAALTPLGQQVRREGLSTWVDGLLAVPVVNVLLWPFKPFVLAFTARWLSADLWFWSAVAVAIDLALVGVVLVINDQYLEASAAVSARIYARIKRARRGEVFDTGTPARRYSLPMLPWWGGLGPNLWRQLTTATRSTSKLIGMLVMFGVPLVMILLASNKGLADASVAPGAISVIVSIALFAPSLVGFDFRPDLERMEDLKTLPIRPSRLVLGQLITPVVILTVTEWAAIAAVATVSPGYPMLFLGAAALALPLNLVLVAVENLYFLWYPFRMTGFNAFDFQAMGRQMLLMAAKIMTVAIAATIALGAGALFYYVLGDSWVAGIAAAWVVVGGVGLALVPLLGQAFVQFDVTETRAE